MVLPSASSDELKGRYNFFRVCPTNSEQTQIAATFLPKTKQKKRIAIIYDETNAYGNSLKNDFMDDVKRDVNATKANIVGPASYKRGEPNTLQEALAKVLAQKPDALFFAGYGSDLPELLKDIPQANNLLIVGGDTLANTNTYTSLPPGLQNVYFTSFASPNEWDGTGQKPPFFQDYQTNFGKHKALTGLSSIDMGVMLNYDALLTLLHASKQALSKHNDTITPSYLEDELKQITGGNAIQGITGRIAFESNGDQDQSKMILLEHIEGTNLVIDERHGCLQKDNCGS